MTVKEVIQLTAAGFKAKDIKELMDLEAAGKNETNEDNSKDPGKTEKKPDETKDPGQDQKAPEDSEDMKPDFEALYKQTLADLDQTKKDLAAAQINNQSAGTREADSDIQIEREKLKDLFRR